MSTEPTTKPKRQLTEAQLANLKKGREAGLAKARAKKAERERQKKEDEEIIMKAKEIKKIDIEPLSEPHEEVITKQPAIKEIEDDEDDADDELEKPQPLLRRRNKKNVEPIETKKEEKKTAKERLAEMRANKKLELEEKKLQLEELRLQKQIEEQEHQINEIKSKPKNSLSSTVPHKEEPTIMYAPRRTRGRGRYF